MDWGLTLGFLAVPALFALAGLAFARGGQPAIAVTQFAVALALGGMVLYGATQESGTVRPTPVSAGSLSRM